MALLDEDGSTGLKCRARLEAGWSLVRLRAVRTERVARMRYCSGFLQMEKVRATGMQRLILRLLFQHQFGALKEPCSMKMYKIKD